MELDKETKEKIHELQILEQNFQNLVLQKQVFQSELSEVENAHSEIVSSEGDVFKLIGQIMVKADKESLEKELKRKKELLSLRLKSIEKQESELVKKMEEMRDEITKKISNK